LSRPLEVEILGTVELKDLPEFLDSKGIVIKYKGQPLPRISELSYEKIPVRIEDKNGIYSEHYIYRLPGLFYKHVLLWIKKAKSEKTGFDKFFALWVAFNSFYRFYYERVKPEGKESDEDRLKKLVNHLITEEEATTLLEMLSPKIKNILRHPGEIKINWGRRDIKAELQTEFEKGNLNKHTFKLLILTLYGIRNNLFHGYKALTNEQEKLLDTAFDVLLPILSLLLIKYLISYHSGDSHASRET
jgi:hypothetical protein